MILTGKIICLTIFAGMKKLRIVKVFTDDTQAIDNCSLYSKGLTDILYWTIFEEN